VSHNFQVEIDNDISVIDPGNSEIRQPYESKIKTIETEEDKYYQNWSDSETMLKPQWQHSIDESSH